MDSNEIEPIKERGDGELSAFIKRITVPLSKRGWPMWLVYLLAILGLIYVLNPTAGILELIPDNIPVIGNLDEGVALGADLCGFGGVF